jgi:hypothetical protein
MAVGDVTYGKYTARIRILENLVAANPLGAATPPPLGGSAPTNSTGIRFDYINRGNVLIRDMSVVVATRSGTGPISVSGRLIGWSDDLGTLVANAGWCPFGKATAEADKGKLNDGQPILGASAVRHAEPFEMATHLDGAYLELTSFSGTSPAFDAWLVIPLNLA